MTEIIQIQKDRDEYEKQWQAAHRAPESDEPLTDDNTATTASQLAAQEEKRETQRRMKLE